MNQAAIIAVGTELLFGTTINTNASHISRCLHELGIGVLAHYVVGDNPKRLRRMLEVAFEEADIVIATGGLGPTQDDLTKEIIAEFMGSPLEYDELAKQYLEDRMASLGRTSYTPNNLKQVYLPKDCTPFYNQAGTAPGFALESQGRLAIALPGPPREMERMMIDSVIPYLTGRSSQTLYSQMLLFRHLGESALETALLPLIDGQSDPTIATYAKQGECMVRITSLRESADEAKAAVQHMVLCAKELVDAYCLDNLGQHYPEDIPVMDVPAWDE